MDTNFSGSSGPAANGKNGLKPGSDRNSGSDAGAPDSDGEAFDADAPESGDPYTHAPITPDLGGGGWVGKGAFPKLEELLGGGGSGGGGGPGNADSGGSGGGGGGGGGDPGSIGDSQSNGNPNTSGDTQPGGDVATWNDDENGIFWVPCSSDNGGGSKEGSIKGPAGAKVRMAGEFCPAKGTQGSLTVLFIVDYSGSMTGSGGGGPNDPGDDCGRMRAADALLKKFSGKDFDGYDLKFSLIGFSSDASVRLPLQDLKSMQGTINPGTWCGSDSSFALTNYSAAFTAAAQGLQGATGRIVVYFISDGIPTAGGGSPEQAGLDAATALRNAHPKDLVLNAVFLGAKDGDNPQGYLEQITGDPKRVRVVGSADSLVDAVIGLDAGLPKIEKSDVKASLEADGTSSTSVAIATLKPHKTKAGAFIYMTESFVLKGEPGKETANELTVKAKTEDDKQLTSKAVINYTVVP